MNLNYFQISMNVTYRLKSLVTRFVPTPLEPTLVAVSVDSSWTAPTVTLVYVSSQVCNGKFPLFVSYIFSTEKKRHYLQSCFNKKIKQNL